MSNIDKQALREIAAAAVGAHERLSVMPPDDIFDISLAEGTQLDADITALNALNSAANPTTVLALLDELDKWQQESSAWQAVAEKQLALAEDAGNRIAELESAGAINKLDSMDMASIPGEMDLLTCHLDGVTETYAEGWNAFRAAMLHGSEPETDNTNQQFESLSRGDK